MAVSLNDLENFCQRYGWTDISLRGLTNLAIRINCVIRHLARMRNWYAYERLGSLQTIAPYTTGTVAVTLASAAVAGTLTVWTAAMAGQEFYAPDGRTYTILTVNSPTQLTLSENYLGATVASGGSYGIRFVKYAVPTGFDRAGQFQNRLGGKLMDGQDLGDWQHLRRSTPITAVYPSNIWVMEDYFYLHPAPTQADQITYPYQVLPVDLTENGMATDWPDRIMWLLYAALGAAVKVNTEGEAQTALELREFQTLVDDAWLSCRPSRVPIQGDSAGDDRIGANERAGKYIFPNS